MSTYHEPSGYPTTIYIDPSKPALNPGDDGTSKDKALNSWSGLTIQPNTAYLQKAGTVFENNSDQHTVLCRASNVYFGAYDTGEKPVIRQTCGTAARFAIYIKPIQNNPTENIVIENMRFEAENTFGVCLYPEHSSISNCKILNNEFYTQKKNLPGDTRTRGCLYLIHGSTSGQDPNPDAELHDIEISGNDFSGDLDKNTTDGLLSLAFFTLQRLQMPYNLKITHNNFHDAPGTGLWLYQPGAISLLTLESPKGVLITDNTFNNLSSAAITTHSGLLSTQEYPSKILRNNMKNIGNMDTPKVNAIQGQYLQDVEIAYNRIDTVLTSAPDGVGIILDWADRLNYKASRNCYLHHNVISGCRAGEKLNPDRKGCAGIAAFVCTNCIIEENYCFDNSVGFSATNSISSGNIFTNNISMHNSRGFYFNIDTRNDTGTLGLQILRNNLIAFNSDYAFYIGNSEQVRLPDTDSNVIYDNTSLCNRSDFEMSDSDRQDDIRLIFP